MVPIDNQMGVPSVMHWLRNVEHLYHYNYVFYLWAASTRDSGILRA